MNRKFYISRLESKLGKLISKNKIVLGWDVSTHSTGFALIRTTNKYLIIERVGKITVPKLNSINELIDLFLSQIREIKSEINKHFVLDINIIEDCFLKFNVDTLKKLARFGCLLYVVFKDMSKQQKFLYAVSARKIIGFHKKKGKGNIKKQVIEYLNNLFEVKIKDDDVADAIVLALAGLINEREK